MPEYDAIIAGASFAGLAVADNLDCDVLLIDRKKIGSMQQGFFKAFPEDVHRMMTIFISSKPEISIDVNQANFRSYG